MTLATVTPTAVSTPGSNLPEQCDYCQQPTPGSALCERDAEVLFGQGPPCSLPAGARVRLLDGVVSHS